MKQWLKRLFIPHEGNAYRPHFLHGRIVRRVALVVLFLELVLYILPTLNYTRYYDDLNLGAVLPGVLSTLTNDERVRENLSQLTENPLLAQAAQLKAEDMASKGYFAHTSPEGKTPWYWFDLVGYKYSYAGENLAVDFTDSAEVTRAWMNSPTHRANIENGAYTEVGTGIATGVYKGHETVFVAQVYGKPKRFTTNDERPTTNNNSQFKINNFQSSINEPIVNENSMEIVNSKIENSERVLGESVPPGVVEHSIETVQEIMSSPRSSTNVALYILLSLVMVALILNIFIKFQYQSPDLITNGVIIIVLIASIYLGNNFVLREKAETSFVAFPSESIE